MNRLTTPIVGAVRRLYRWDHQMDPRIAWLSPMPPARSGSRPTRRRCSGARTDRLHAGQAQDPAVLADQAQALGDGAVAHDGRLPPRQQHGVPRRHLRPRDPNAGAPGDPRPRARRLRDGHGCHRAAVRAPGPSRGTPARAPPPRVRGGRTQRTAPRPLHRARRSARARDRCPLALRRTLPACVRLQDPDLCAPHPVIETEQDVRRAEGRARDPRVARVDGDADAGRRVRRPERRQADRRRPRGDGAPAPGRPPRARRPPDPGVRHEPMVRASGLGRVCRCTPTSRTKTSWRGCAPRTSRWTSDPRIAGRCPGRSRARCSVGVRGRERDGTPRSPRGRRPRPGGAARAARARRRAPSARRRSRTPPPDRRGGTNAVGRARGVRGDRPCLRR